MKVLRAKYIRKARMWVVTTIEESGKEKVQKQHWFSELNDAVKFYLETDKKK